MHFVVTALANYHSNKAGSVPGQPHTHIGTEPTLESYPSYILKPPPPPLALIISLSVNVNDVF